MTHDAWAIWNPRVSSLATRPSQASPPFGDQNPCLWTLGMEKQDPVSAQTKRRTRQISAGGSARAKSSQKMSGFVPQTVSIHI